MRTLKPKLLAALTMLTVSYSVSIASGQGTAFTYQGKLNNGVSTASGTYNLQFTLYSTNIGGIPAAEPVTNTGVSITNGLFTVTIDFGSGVWNGETNWLEIGVESNGVSGFTTLAPRQQLTPTPYAITAANVLGGGLSAGVYGNAVALSNPANQFTGSYAGNGAGLSNVAGTLAAQTVAGTSVQAAPNTAYLLTNNSLVTVTLPLAPNPGDVIRLACSGYSGWQLLQNPGQSVLGVNLVGSGGNWSQVVTNRGLNRWIHLVSSPDGNHLVAVGVGSLLLSEDGGATWTNFFGLPSYAICESADGSQLAQAVPGNGINVSTNFGTNFSLNFMLDSNWSAIAASTDFSHMAAAVSGGGIYYSSGPTTNWAASDAPTSNWVAIAASLDGSRMAAVAAGGGIYVSKDFGTNWTPAAAPTNAVWSGIASSADGSRLAASAANGIYISSDSGTSWAIASGLTNTSSWDSIASSADGTHLIAGTSSSGAGVFISTDAGVTWAPAKLPGGDTWYAMASSGAGTFVAAGNISGAIYIYKTATTTGTTGYLSGGGNTAVTLEYMGNGIFLPISHEGTLLPH